MLLHSPEHSFLLPKVVISLPKDLLSQSEAHLPMLWASQGCQRIKVRKSKPQPMDQELILYFVTLKFILHCQSSSGRLSCGPSQCLSHFPISLLGFSGVISQINYLKWILVSRSASRGMQTMPFRFWLRLCRMHMSKAVSAYISFAVCFFQSLSKEEKSVLQSLPPLNLGRPRASLWPTEWSRSDGVSVPSPGIKDAWLFHSLTAPWQKPPRTGPDKPASNPGCRAESPTMAPTPVQSFQPGCQLRLHYLVSKTKAIK